MDATSPPVLVTITAIVTCVATIGGIGGAVLLVPILVLAGLQPHVAVPLGMVSVAAGSLAAAAPQIRGGLVNHRLGVVLEVAASAGAIVGVVLTASTEWLDLRFVLGGVAILAAALDRQQPAPDAITDDPDDTAAALGIGELPGRLAGVVPGPATYEAKRMPAGFGLMAAVGVIAGLSGTSGGYLRTPLLRHVVGLPTKSAAATTTFTVGITAATALGVIALQGRLDGPSSSAVVVGAILGGWTGSSAQRRWSARSVRLVMPVLLAAIGVLVIAWG